MNILIIMYKEAMMKWDAGGKPAIVAELSLQLQYLRREGLLMQLRVISHKTGYCHLRAH